jgi:ATP-dependent helicase/nuclease subunit B
VIDYKLHGNSLALERVYHGIALQLLTYLLVMQAHGEQLAGRKLTPAAAFYVRLLRRLEDVKHPEDALPPEDPAFDLQVKPRGLFDDRYRSNLDNQLTTGSSQVVQLYVNKEGGIGRRNSSDASERHEFEALLAHVQKRLGELADAIISGCIDVRPFRIRTATPCPTCEFRSVCRFDVTMNRYQILESMGREQVLQRVLQETSNEQ